MKKRRKVLLLCILMAVTVFTTLVVIYFPKTTPIPNELIGVWITSSPKYAKRFFAIKKDSLIFGTSKLLNDHGIISKINKTVQDESILYAIDYESGQDGKQQFSFFYDPVNRTIRFKNKKQTEWKKIKGDSYELWLKHWWGNGVRPGNDTEKKS